MEPVVSYIVTDHYTGKILGQKEATRKVPVASLTKLATACVVLDWAAATHIELPKATVRVPEHAALLGPGSPVGLRPGDQLSLRDALYAALLVSDNVAAEALATHVGLDLLRRRGKSGAGPEEFIQEMNALALGKLGMKNTRFVNPHGLDHGLRRPPLSTAADMARLTRYAMDKEALKFIVGRQERTITIQRFGETQKRELKNTNTLLGRNGIDGVKTGQTRAAGQCLIISAKKSNLVSTLPNGDKRVQKRRLNVVVLGAADRFRSAKALLDWGWREHQGWNAAGRPMADANGTL